MHIKADEVRGYKFENELVCLECAIREGLVEISPENILIESAMADEDWYFCDRCNAEL